MILPQKVRVRTRSPYCVAAGRRVRRTSSARRFMARLTACFLALLPTPSRLLPLPVAGVSVSGCFGEFAEDVPLDDSMTYS